MSYLNDLFNLDNKTIIITGAGSGNGKTLAIALAKLNCKLIICDNIKICLAICSKNRCSI